MITTIFRFFLSLDLHLKYWIEHVTIWHLYIKFILPTRLFYSGIPGFATDRPCDVWCRGLTACLPYVGPCFGDLALDESWFLRLKTHFPCFESVYIYVFTYITISCNMIMHRFYLPNFYVIFVSNAHGLSFSIYDALIYWRNKIYLHALLVFTYYA